MIKIVIPFITSACNVLVFVSIPRHISVLNTRPDVYTEITYRFNSGGRGGVVVIYLLCFNRLGGCLQETQLQTLSFKNNALPTELKG